MFGWTKLKYTEHYLNGSNPVEFHNLLKLIGKVDLDKKLVEWEKSIKTNAPPMQLAYYGYDVNYRVKALEDGLLFEVKYMQEYKYGSTRIMQYLPEETFVQKVNFLF